MGRLRVLELYSGIGGMHCSFKKSTLPYEVVAAVDINDTATMVYKHVFPKVPVWNRIIENLSADELQDLNADVWSMSPPCQPFTRLGNRKCEADNRTNSFKHVLELIDAVLPRIILLENVKGFEYTEPWKQLIDVLLKCNYRFEQFLLSPLQFGIPNCRLRYYLIAIRGSPVSADSVTLPCSIDKIHLKPPQDSPSLPDCSCPVCLRLTKHIEKLDDNLSAYLPYCQSVSNFLLPEAISLTKLSSLSFLSDSCLKRYFYVLDIVQPCDKKTRCFTKHYSKRMEGTGSVLQTSEMTLTSKSIHEQWEQKQHNSDELLSFEKSLNLRFFHSQEIANFLCFPSAYEFPANVSEKQRLRLLGNSINVLVVAHLLYWSLGDSNH